MYCSQCGAAQSDRAKFCSRCGSQLDKAGPDWPAPAPAPAEQTPPAAPSPGTPAEYRSPDASPTADWGPTGQPWPTPPAREQPAAYVAPTIPPGYMKSPPPPVPGYTPPAPPPGTGYRTPGDAEYPQAPPPGTGYRAPGDAEYPQAPQPPAASAYPQAPQPPASVYWASTEPAARAYPPPQPGVPDYMQPQPAAPAYAPPRRRRRGVIAAVAAVIVVLGALAAAGWREHWPPAVFGRSTLQPLTWNASQPPLPADAIRSASQNAGLDDVACSDVQHCVSVGYYTYNNNGSIKGLIETLSDGAWTPAGTTAGVPAASKSTFIQLDGVACPSAGACVSVGGYYDSHNIGRPLIGTVSGSTWTPARPALPGDADQGKSAFLSQVACPAQGACVAAGWYTDRNGNTQGLIDTLSGGTWTAARAPLPAGAVPGKSSTNLPTALYVVKCPAVGSCVAAGDYTGGSGSTQGLIDTLAGGVWTAVRAPLPGDAAAVNPIAYLWAVTCTAPGACLATGHYSNRNGQNRNLLETLSGGTWTPATMPMPADAAAAQKWSSSQQTGLSAVVCRTSGACVAAGSYVARGGTVQGVVDTQSGGTWTAARAPLPADAVVAKQYVFIDSAVCPAADNCLVVGGYKTKNGATQNLIETGTAKSG